MEPVGRATLLRSMVGAMLVDLVNVVTVTTLEKNYLVILRLRKERSAQPATVGRAKSTAHATHEETVELLWLMSYISLLD
jgi:hypothetical protein